MAFAFTQDGHTTEGDKRYVWGTFTSSAGGEGGDIDTGLTICENLMLTHKAAAVVASAPVVNETLPIAGSAVTIVTVADTVGYWLAVGY